MRKTIATFLFMCVVGLMLVAIRADAQTDGNYHREANVMTPRQYLNYQRDLLARYPLLEAMPASPRPLARKIADFDRAKAAAHPVPLRVGNQPLLYGSVISSQARSEYDLPEYGIYSLPLVSASTADLTKLGDDDIRANGGGVLTGDIYNWVSFEKYYYGYVATYYNAPIATWSTDAIKSVANNFISTDMAYDEITGSVVACCYNEAFTGFELVSLDLSTLSRKVICYLGTTRYVGLAFSNEGVLYGIRTDGTLCTIRLSDGEATEVGSLGVKVSAYSQSATFDPATDKLYFSYLLDNNNGGLYEVNTTTGKATLVTRYANNEQLVGIFIPKPATAPAAPAAPTGLSATFDGNSTEGVVTFTMPTTLHDGSAATGTLVYVVEANGKQLQTDEAEPGEHVGVPVSLETGMNRIVVYATNGAGKGDETAVRQWVGYDQPAAVDNLKATIDASGKAAITWTAPSKGVHDKPLDADALTYNVVRMPDNSIVATGIKENVATDQIADDETNSYSYEVTPLHHGVEGVATTSDPQVYGSHFKIPYTHLFAGDDALAYYTVVDGNNDETTWEENEDKDGVEYFAYFAEGDADDWLVSPTLQMYNDRTYRMTLHMDLGSFGQDQSERMSVWIGSPTGEMKEVLLPDTAISGRGENTLSFSFRVAQAGDYKLGLHLTTPAGQGGSLTLKSLAVDVEAMDDAPAAISDLTVKPDPNGKLQASISLTAPTRNVVGNTLDELVSVTLIRDDSVVVAEQAQIKGGTLLEFSDTGMDNGVHSYKAYASNSTGQGMTAEATAFIGVDIPNPPTDVVLSETGDDMAHVSWTPVTSGANGGFVSAERISYRAQRSDNTWITIDAKGDTVFDDVESEVKLLYRQGELYYHLHAVNEKGQSERATSNVITIGQPYPLPYSEHFNIVGTTNSGWRLVNYGEGRFRTPFDEKISADGDGYCAIFTPKEVGDSSDYISSKIDLERAVRPGVHFYYYAYPGSEAKLIVKAEKNQDGNPTVLAEIDFAKLTGNEGWRDTTLLLKNVDGARYVMLHFLASSHDVGTPVAIDAIEVRDMLEHNLTVSLPSGSALTAGQANEIRVKVRNLGLLPAEDFTVELLADRKVLASAPGGILEAGKDTTYTVDWMPANTDTGVVNIAARVNYLLDEYPADNTTDAQPFEVVFSEYPTVEITGTVTSESIIINWETPQLQTDDVTEGFEDYAPWARELLGKWTLVDEDGGRTWGLSSKFSWYDEPKSWIVLNSDSLYEMGIWNEQNPLDAYDGGQYLASFAANYLEAVNCADWIISPNISATKPHISFYARKINSKNDPEWLAVKYSTTDKRTSSFMLLPNDTVITDLTTEWKEYSFDLPEGTKYFALENVAPTSGDNSGYPFAIFVDNITYTPIDVDLTLEGYKVYRDSTCIATLGADDQSFTDSSIGNNEPHNYQVSVVYNLGESPLSNLFSAVLTGVESIAQKCLVVSGDGFIRIQGGNDRPLAVYTNSGSCVARLAKVQDTVIDLPSGSYLIRIGQETVKTVVR